MSDNTNNSNKDKVNTEDAAARQARMDAEKLLADKAKESSSDARK
jgi:hypothetical protein